MEKEIVQELNELRRDPKGYSNKISNTKIILKMTSSLEFQEFYME